MRFGPATDNMRIASICFTLALSVLSAPAQTSTSYNGWYMYFGDHPVSEHWGIHLEGQWRRSSVITGMQQVLLRPAINYQVNDRLAFSTGYAWLRSYPFGELPSDAAREHRVYQEASVTHSLARVKMEHRFRLEQRFEAAVGKSDWEYMNRARYRLQGRVPLRSGSMDTARLYASIYEEVYANWGAHAERTLDQNRTYGALGVRIGEKTRLEMGYCHQYLPQSGSITRHNHTFQLSLFSEIPFRSTGP